jgi:hypothetical protein
MSNQGGGLREVVVITGQSGSGKGSVLKALEDLGYYSVDNLPVDLIPKFAELTRDNPGTQATALVVDIREGEGLKRFPAVLSEIRKGVDAKLVFLEADESALVRRFSETRRPHPLGADRSIVKSIRAEKRQLGPIRSMADLIISTSKFTVHELREFIGERFRGQRDESKILIYVTSFGYRHGVPADSDGFVAVDPHGAVTALDDVWAAGDLTAFPVKQGGLAAQQADAAAEAIAHRAGADLEPAPFRPVLRGLLLTGLVPRFLRADEPGGRSTADTEPLWWPPAKIVGRYLAPFLAKHLGLSKVLPDAARAAALPVEVELTATSHGAWSEM